MSLLLSPNFAHKEYWGYYQLIKYSIKTDSPKREVPFAQVLSELQQPSLSVSWLDYDSAVSKNEVRTSLKYN